MKYKLFAALCLGLCLLAFRAPDAIEKGVNYDPVHSLEFARAVGQDDRQGMIDAIEKDLDKIIELHEQGYDWIRHLKTFFTTFSSLGADPSRRVEINIADVVADWNRKNPQHAVKLALGVYQFRPGIDACSNEATCVCWTRSQIDAAVDGALRYPDMIDRIIVGNENLSLSPQQLRMEKRIADDISAIKSRLNTGRGSLLTRRIPVGTAQTANMVNDTFYRNHFQLVKQQADFIGVNVYPYWDQVPYGNPPYRESPAKRAFQQYWTDLDNVRNGYQVIETEEGWPSAGSATASPEAANDYLHYWYNRDAKVAPVSYYFALFDKLPGQGVESNWGIYSADRHSSILGAPGDAHDFGKPLAPGHVVIRFKNPLVKVTEVNACAGDWEAGIDSQQGCYPLGGYAGTGVIKPYETGEFMLDTTGASYSSLNVVYRTGTGAARLCYIDRLALGNLTSKTRVVLNWQNDAGNIACQLERP